MSDIFDHAGDAGAFPLGMHHTPFTDNQPTPTNIMTFEYWKSEEDGQWHWHLRAANNEIIAEGEAYNNKADCLHAIELVRGVNCLTEVVEKN